MKKLIDLHIHSNLSEDGDLSVEEIFRQAIDLSLSAISITDHDSIESISIAKAINREIDIEYIPGVEITTVFSEDGSQQHILGYFIDERNTDLQSVLKRIYNFRVSIAKKRIDALKNIGFELDDGRIWEMAGTRAPTATSIMSEIFNNKKNMPDKRLKAYFHGEKSRNRLPIFYKEYLTEEQPAYVPFESIPVIDGISVIKKAGGIPILAHPIFVKKNEMAKSDY